MYTKYTYQDWEKVSGDKAKFAKTVVDDYKSSAFFGRCLESLRYFVGDNPSLDDKCQLRIETREAKDASGRIVRRAQRESVPSARVSSNYLFRFITQENQTVLGNGVTLDDDIKARLGAGFDKALEQAGERALLQSVVYGFWNLDHLEVIPACVDADSGAVALLDEMTSQIRVLIQFWQLSSDKPIYMRIFDAEGVRILRVEDGEAREYKPLTAYKTRVVEDSIGTRVVGTSNYNGLLPIIPMYGNPEHESELKQSIKSKIDCYDRIMSDFGDNLDRANDVYWVLSNFGGNTDEALDVIQQIQELKIAMSVSDGTTTSDVRPETISVPYEARQTALTLLDRALYADAMALDTNALTGGSLTNVAIRAAMTNLNLKCDRYEWQAFQFVQELLSLIGVKTEKIRFVRSDIANKSETVQDIYVMRSDITRKKALELNPYINPDEIDEILKDMDAEDTTGIDSVERLQEQIDKESEA